MNNETQKFSDSVIINYLSGIGSAIKSSSYSVWTRANTIDSTSTVQSRISINNSLRSGAGTNLDFVGIDNYSNTPSVIQAIMPQTTGNFAEVMENGGINSAAARLAALAGNEAMVLHRQRNKLRCGVAGARLDDYSRPVPDLLPCIGTYVSMISDSGEAIYEQEQAQ